MIQDNDKFIRVKEGEYSAFRTTLTADCSNYYIMASHNIAIPVVPTASDSYHLICEQLQDWNGPESVHLLPTISATALTAIGTFTIVPVLQEVLRSAPVKILTVMEKEAIADGKRRQSEAWLEEKKPKAKIGYMKL
jgi:hypothetical protein